MTNSIDWASLRSSADDAMRPAPDGDYTLKCVKAEAKVASTGSHMVAAQFNIEGGPSHGKTVFTNIVLTPDKAFALNMFFRTMDALGIDPTANGGLSMEQIAASMVGAIVDAKLGHRPWQGTDRNEVQEWRPNPMNPRRGASPAAPSTAGGSSQPPAPSVAAVPPTPSPAAAQSDYAVATGAVTPIPQLAGPIQPPPDEPF